MDPSTPSPIQKSIRYAMLMVGLSVPVFAALIFAALYVPENFFLHSTKSSNLEGLMPLQSQLPTGMLLVGESIDKNEDIAKKYPDTQEMLKRLEAFERVEGFSRDYVLIEHRQTGPRLISLNLVTHKQASGAQDYWQWLFERNRSGADQYQPVQIGQGGYLFWSTVDCTTCGLGEKEQELEISFHRNQFLATVRLRVGNTQNRLEEVLPLGMSLANALDKRLQGLASDQ